MMSVTKWPAMKQCDDCATSGFSDRVHRGFWAMEPSDKICRTCGGRGWVEATPLNKEEGAET